MPPLRLCACVAAHATKQTTNDSLTLSSAHIVLVCFLGRMQLRTQAGSKRGPVTTAARIISNEGFFALYKGLSAVMAGIVPKMAVRFTSFEAYKGWLGANKGDGSKGKKVAKKHYRAADRTHATVHVDLCLSAIDAD